VRLLSRVVLVGREPLERADPRRGYVDYMQLVRSFRDRFRPVREQNDPEVVSTRPRSLPILTFRSRRPDARSGRRNGRGAPHLR
jgi:hypothetical protein